MTEQERQHAIQIDNFKFISGKKLTMGYEEKNNEAILFGVDEMGRRYTLDVLPLPKKLNQ